MLKKWIDEKIISTIKFDRLTKRELKNIKYIKCSCGLDYEEKDLFCPRCLLSRKELTKGTVKNNI